MSSLAGATSPSNCATDFKTIKLARESAPQTASVFETSGVPRCHDVSFPVLCAGTHAHAIDLSLAFPQARQPGNFYQRGPGGALYSPLEDETPHYDYGVIDMD